MANRPGESLPPMGEVLEFMRALWAVDHGLQSTSKRMESELGVTGPQRLVIRLVGRFPGVSAGVLARSLHIDPSTLTGILKRLETRGILKRTIDPEDGRRALLSLTSKGKQIDARKSGTVEAAVRRTLARLPPDRVAAAREVLTTLGRELVPEDE